MDIASSIGYVFGLLFGVAILVIITYGFAIALIWLHKQAKKLLKSK